jgi:hypothetical protein
LRAFAQRSLNWRGDEDIVRSFKGPALAMMSEQSPVAESWLEFFKDIIEKDRDYAERLARHYKMVKESL